MELSALIQNFGPWSENRFTVAGPCSRRQGERPPGTWRLAGRFHDQDPTASSRSVWESEIMLRWAVVFLVIALVAAVLGFGGLAGTAVGIAKILFFVFLVLFAVSLVLNLLRGRAG